LDKIFGGLLPSSSYAMIFRKFIQKWECSNSEITQLVKAISGKNLSFRQVDELVTAYFTLEDGIPERIIEGKIAHVLELLMPSSSIPVTKLESELDRKIEQAILSLGAVSTSLGRLQEQSELTPAFKSILSYRSNSILARMVEVKRRLTDLSIGVNA
jgi:hypothetical protein